MPKFLLASDQSQSRALPGGLNLNYTPPSLAAERKQALAKAQGY